MGSFLKWLASFSVCVLVLAGCGGDAPKFSGVDLRAVMKQAS